MNDISRRKVLSATAAGLVIPSALASQAAKVQKPEPIAAATVKEFVGAAHGKLDRVKEMLEESPSLLNATWDWGGGDFEMAIGGAGHMGRADIANYLIEKGARFDIFVAAMLGRLDVVKATLVAYPALKDSAGPHGISLLRHAEAGGKGAEPVLEYVKNLK